MELETTFKKIAIKLLEKGYEPIPIRPGTKIPYVKDWNQGAITQERIESWIKQGFGNHYVGIRTGKLVAIDFDLDDAALAEKLYFDVQFWFGRGPVRWGRPGRFLKILRAENPKLKKQILKFDTPEGEKKIEILRSGQQFVAFGIHPITRKPFNWEAGNPLTFSFDDLPCIQTKNFGLTEYEEGLKTLLPKTWVKKTSVTQVTDEKKFLLSFKPQHEIKAMSLKDRVNFEAMKNFDWVFNVFGSSAKPYQGGFRISSKNLGRSLQEDISIHPDGIQDFGEERGLRPLDVVTQWHSGGDEAKATSILARWVGIDPETYAPVIEKETLADEKEILSDCNSKTELKKALENLDLARYDSLDLEKLKIVWASQCKEIEGLKPSKKIVTEVFDKILKRQKAPRTQFLESLFENWFYLTEGDVFYHRITKQVLTRIGFESVFKRKLYSFEEFRKEKVSCVHLALNEIEIPTVIRAQYDPTEKKVFDFQGQRMVNSYVHENLPKHLEPKIFSDFDRMVVDTFKNHFRFLSGFRPEVEKLLVQWFAFCVQNPGRKIRFTPIIKGVEGDGKSTLMNLLSACIGPVNTGVVDANVISSKFNSWAEGSQVTALEEIRVVGHNRFEVMNSLKQLITNDAITIHKKGKSPYVCKNVTNYISFTNYVDALALTETDRRWIPIFTPWRSLKEMAEMCQINLEKHFKTLYRGIRNHAPALRGWLLSVDLSDFNVDKPKIKTAEKRAMLDIEKKDDVDELRNFLSSVSIKKGVFPKVIFGKALEQKQREYIYTGLSENNQPWPRGKRLKKLMMEFGWMKINTADGRLSLKLPGTKSQYKETVWVRGFDANDSKSIRKYIEDFQSGKIEFIENHPEEEE